MICQVSFYPIYLLLSNRVPRWPKASGRATPGRQWGLLRDSVRRGLNGAGTIFKFTLGGTVTTLHNFCSQSGCPDGQNSYAGLVQATNGDFYGTTVYGGTAGGYGTIFRLSVGLRPFVETQTTAGQVGAAVKILGSNLTGATSVSFSDTAAVFTVVSRYLITATVPAGASSGKVKVITPNGTLSSNEPFRVLP
jgi:uncharacterized repeat protein (TIGR03803 family)